MKTIAVLLLCMFTGCATIRSAATINLPFVTTESQVACGLILTNAVDDADREDVAKMMYYAGDVLADLSGGTIPSLDQFRAFLAAEGFGKVVKYQQILDSLAELYAAKIKSFSGDAKLCNDCVAAIARGAKLAAKPYVNDPSI